MHKSRTNKTLKWCKIILNEIVKLYRNILNSYTLTLPGFLTKFGLRLSIVHPIFFKDFICLLFIALQLYYGPSLPLLNSHEHFPYLYQLAISDISLAMAMVFQMVYYSWNWVGAIFWFTFFDRFSFWICCFSHIVL